MQGPHQDKLPKVILEHPELHLAELPPAPVDWRRLLKPAYADLDTALRAAGDFAAEISARVSEQGAIMGADARPIRIDGDEWFTPHLRIAGGEAAALPHAIFPALQASDGRLLVDEAGAVRCAAFEGANALHRGAPPGFEWGLFANGERAPLVPIRPQCEPPAAPPSSMLLRGLAAGAVLLTLLAGALRARRED